MKSRMKHAILILLALVLSGCASLLTTPMQDCANLCGKGKTQVYSGKDSVYGEGCQCRRDESPLEFRK